MFDTPNDNPIMTLTIHTNINPEDYEKLAVLLSALESATQECGRFLDSKHIEIRHNSPNIVDLFASGSFEELIKAFQHVYFILLPVIADLASIITLGGAVGTAGKLIWNKVTDNGAASHKKTCAPELQKLRKELNRLLASNQNGYEQLPTFHTNVGSLLSEKLIGVTNQ